MHVILNGQDRNIGAGWTVQDLLANLGFDARRIAVERNLEIVPRSQYAATALNEGDRLEIVNFVGGG